MIGKKYKLTIYRSVLDWSHRMGQEIEELFLPEVGIGMDQESIFRTDPARYKTAKELGEVEVAEHDVEIFQEYLEKKAQCKRIAKKYLES